jgi:hypothetical protein
MIVKERVILASRNRINVAATFSRKSVEQWMTPWMGYIFVWDKKFATEHFLPLLEAILI